MKKTDILILNTAVMDLRNREFSFADKLALAGGLAVCPVEDMPTYSDEELSRLIREGHATAGGSGNTAPLVAKAGLKTAVAAYVGRGAFDGLDLQGSLWRKALSESGVDVSGLRVHPTLPTGTTFIHEVPAGDRGGIAFFPNANNDFDFVSFRSEVNRLAPALVYYMYSGLSKRGDANGGRDLAAFMRSCRDECGAITIADSHTLTGDPQKVIASRKGVPGYRLLEPLLPTLNIFFCSLDEAQMISDTLFPERSVFRHTAKPADGIGGFLDVLAEKFAEDDSRTRWFGVTVKNGAYVLALSGHRVVHGPAFCETRYHSGGIVDLVGAGDSFRGGLVGCIASDAPAFLSGRMDPEAAVQCGNLMAASYITSPLEHRYRMIPKLSALKAAVASGNIFNGVDALRSALGTAVRG